MIDTDLSVSPLLEASGLIGIASDSIEPRFLLSDEFTSRSNLLNADEELNIWYCRSKGKQWVISEQTGAQNIKTKTIPSSVISQVNAQLDIVDRLTGLKLKRTRKKSSADIRIYLDKKISLGLGPEYVGLSIFNSQSKHPCWEIFINAAATRNNNHMIYAILHEVGHTLGLEHTHDSKDGDYYNATVASRSSLPRQTVMSYGRPEWNIYPEQYQVNDLRALQVNWGIDKNAPNVDLLTRSPVEPVLLADSIIDIKVNSKHDYVIQGKACPNSLIKTYLSNTYYQQTRSSKDGTWNIRFPRKYLNRQPIQLGAYLRIEQLDPAGYLTRSAPYFINFL